MQVEAIVSEQVFCKRLPNYLKLKSSVVAKQTSQIL